MLVILTLCVHKQCVSGRSIATNPTQAYEEVVYNDLTKLINAYELDSGADAARNPWSTGFRHSYARSPRYFSLRRSDMRYMPSSKRGIPIELQKALFAHGIVG